MKKSDDHWLAFTLLTMVVLTAWSGAGPAGAQMAGTAQSPVWTMPEVGALPEDAHSRLVRRGRDLITATYACIGPEVPQPADRHMTMLPSYEGFAKDYEGADYHSDGHSHIDAFCHVAFDGLLFDGVPASEVTDRGALSGTIEELENGLVGRGCSWTCHGRGGSSGSSRASTSSPRTSSRPNRRRASPSAAVTSCSSLAEPRSKKTITSSAVVKPPRQARESPPRPRKWNLCGNAKYSLSRR